MQQAHRRNADFCLTILQENSCACQVMITVRKAAGSLKFSKDQIE